MPYVSKVSTEVSKLETGHWVQTKQNYKCFTHKCYQNDMYWSIFFSTLLLKRTCPDLKKPWTMKLKTQTEQNVFIETNTTI